MLTRLLWFIEGDPLGDLIAKVLKQKSSVIHKPFLDFWISKTSQIFEIRGQVPMMHGDQGFNVVFPQSPNQLPVVLNATRIGRVDQTSW